MKNKKAKKNETGTGKARPDYASQDFKQGRAGMQSGHTLFSDTFNQFQNSGNAAFAGEKAHHTADLVKVKGSK